MQSLGIDGELFQTYVLSPQEEKDGKRLTELQRAVLHNLRAQIAQTKLNLVFTPENVINYAQQEACLTGQLDLLDELLTPVSDETS